MWNEPSSFETLKILFGGDTLNVKIKYLDDAIVSRTPVIVLSNSDCFSKDTEFGFRKIKYTWKPCNKQYLVRKLLYFKM